jgi:hypothetical protein
LPDLTAADLSKLIRGEEWDPVQVSELRARYHELQGQLGESFEKNNLADSGWGVVFAADADPAVREKLAPLLQLRRTQASGTNPVLYRELVYAKGESKIDFLRRYKVGFDAVVPERVPYYLLIVGDPEAIPFRVQYQLDVRYAVGRIHFPQLEDYALYAKSVVDAETAARRPRRAAFVATKNADDRPTRLSATHLAPALADAAAAVPGWTVERWFAGQATKDRLARLVGGEAPALLFTASHGVAFPKGDPRQEPHQGALLCQDWPGPIAGRGPIPVSQYLSADDIADDASLAGMVAIHFACYGAGTPRLDDFAHLALSAPTEIAAKSFVARLPQRLLARGALAVIGHVDRAWGHSFFAAQVGAQLEYFKGTLRGIMNGRRVGSAMEYFNDRYAEISTDLTSELDNIRAGMTPDDIALADLWTANNDARSYVLLGDPAVSI